MSHISGGCRINKDTCHISLGFRIRSPYLTKYDANLGYAPVVRQSMTSDKISSLRGTY